MNDLDRALAKLHEATKEIEIELDKIIAVNDKLAEDLKEAIKTLNE